MPPEPEEKLEIEGRSIDGHSNADMHSIAESERMHAQFRAGGCIYDSQECLAYMWHDLRCSSSPLFLAETRCPHL